MGTDGIELGFGFNPLGCRCHAQAAAQGDDGLDDLEIGVRRPHILDERAVDLDLVEGKRPQVGERGIAGSEIVHRNAYAHGAQGVEGFQSLVGITEQHGFGDFQLKAAGWQASRFGTLVETLALACALEFVELGLPIGRLADGPAVWLVRRRSTGRLAGRPANQMASLPIGRPTIPALPCAGQPAGQSAGRWWKLSRWHSP